MGFTFVPERLPPHLTENPHDDCIHTPHLG